MNNDEIKVTYVLTTRGYTSIVDTGLNSDEWELVQEFLAWLSTRKYGVFEASINQTKDSQTGEPIRTIDRTIHERKRFWKIRPL